MEKISSRIKFIKLRDLRRGREPTLTDESKAELWAGYVDSRFDRLLALLGQKIKALPLDQQPAVFKLLSETLDQFGIE